MNTIGAYFSIVIIKMTTQNWFMRIISGIEMQKNCKKILEKPAQQTL